MFFVRSSATLRKSEIRRLEAEPRTPSNTPSSIQEEELEISECSTENIPEGLAKAVVLQKEKGKHETVKIILCRNENNLLSCLKNFMTGRQEKHEKKDDTKQENHPKISSITYIALKRPSCETDKHLDKSKSDPDSKTLNTAQNSTNRKKTRSQMKSTTRKLINKRYKNISSRVDTGRRKKDINLNEESKQQNNEREKRCLAVQTSGTFQDGSGDLQSIDFEGKREVSKEEEEKLERYRRVNMKIIEAVSKIEEDELDQESSETEDYDSELESLEDIRRKVMEEENEEKIDEEAYRSCLFLNENYPNYFQHLIVRYQLNVPTTDQKELRMRKNDIIRIASDCTEKLVKLENMYKERSVQKPVNISCDEF